MIVEKYNDENNSTIELINIKITDKYWNDNEYLIDYVLSQKRDNFLFADVASADIGNNDRIKRLSNSANVAKAQDSDNSAIVAKTQRVIVI